MVLLRAFAIGMVDNIGAGEIETTSSISRRGKEKNHLPRIVQDKAWKHVRLQQTCFKEWAAIHQDRPKSMAESRIHGIAYQSLVHGPTMSVNGVPAIAATELKNRINIASLIR